jgi:hypothetical protein
VLHLRPHVLTSQLIQELQLCIHRYSSGVGGGLSHSGVCLFSPRMKLRPVLYVFFPCSGFRFRGSGFTALPSLDSVIVPTDARRPLAVIPPAPGRLRSYLVVGTQRDSDLLVLALPECVIVHRHWLEGVRVMGLATNLYYSSGASTARGAPASPRAITQPVMGISGGGTSGKHSSGTTIAFGRVLYPRPEKLTGRSVHGSPRTEVSEGATGQVLYVMDGATSAALVFRWPLVGMPDLE